MVRDKDEGLVCVVSRFNYIDDYLFNLKWYNKASGSRLDCLAG